MDINTRRDRRWDVYPVPLTRPDIRIAEPVRPFRFPRDMEWSPGDGWIEADAIREAEKGR